MFKKKNRKKVWKHISKDVQVRLCRTLKHNRILCNSWEVRPNLFPKGYPDGLHIIFFQVYGNSCCLPRKQEGEKKWVQLSQARITAKNVVYSVRDLFFAVAQSSLSLWFHPWIFDHKLPKKRFLDLSDFLSASLFGYDRWSIYPWLWHYRKFSWVKKCSILKTSLESAMFFFDKPRLLKTLKHFAAASIFSVKKAASIWGRTLFRAKQSENPENPENDQF